NLVEDKRDYAQNQVFEKYIDVPLQRSGVLERHAKMECIYIFYVQRACDKGDGALPWIKAFDAPVNIYAFGATVQRCSLCSKEGHLADKCERIGLRMTFSQICNVTLREHLFNTTSARKSQSGQTEVVRQTGRICGSPQSNSEVRASMQ